MITYEWKVVSMQTVNEPLPNTATFATFNVIARDDAGNIASESGAVNLVPADPENFTPWDQVDAALRVGMVKDALRQPGKDAPEVYEQRLADQLNAGASPAATHTFE